MSRYLDPKNDLIFKRIFGEHKHLCISLLNNMLPFEAGQEIVELEYLTNELVPELIGYRHSIVDVRCRDSRGRQFLVEMQIRYTKSFQERVLYNAAKAYSMQLLMREGYKLLEPVYALVFLDTNMNDLEKYYHHYQLLDVDDNKRQIKGIELIFIELRKFVPSGAVESKLHNLWLRFLTEVNEEKEEISSDLYSNSLVSEALGYSEKMGYSRGQLYTYNRLLDSILTERMFMDDAWEDGLERGIAEGMERGIERGIEKGIEQGIEQGIAETQKNIAINLLKEGMPVNKIHELTKLSINDINKLK